MTEVKEEWRSIHGLEGHYEVSSYGQVRSLDRIIKSTGEKRNFESRKSGKILKPTFDGKRKRYLRVILPPQKVTFIHRLVAEHFIGPIPRDKEVAHLDGNSLNNVAANLAIVTHMENEKHKEWHGTVGRGETHAQAKLTAEQVREIRLLGPHDSHAVLAEHYGVTKSMISKILLNIFWHDPAYKAFSTRRAVL
jgi:hypothetical protein